MNKIHQYNKEIYNFDKLISNLFQKDLNLLHEMQVEKYNLFTEIGNDSNTEFHQKFYQKLKEPWDEIINLYKKFISNVIFPILKDLTGETEFAYQTFPTFRVQLPNNVAVVKYHTDSDSEHQHPEGEINFILPLTKMFDTSAIWAESEPNKGDFKPLNLELGELLCWNFNKCKHGNKINETGVTRVSMDFRILPLSKYTSDNIGKISASNKCKYTIGNYYRYLSSETINNYKARDPWDREKEFFNCILEKYQVKDPWDIVLLFEKKIAEYAGSKYAVSVDNCTDGLFLCLKYLNASGKIKIPARTYVSVPCAIIHAGCEIEWEDVEWEGAYQLKPYPVYDGAVRFRKNMYQKDTFHCLSFHIRKHLPIGKGGMILCDDYEAYKWFKEARYEGRHIDDGILYKEDTFNVVGWNMYMTPEQAAKGLMLLEKIPDWNPDQESSGTSKDLSTNPIYTETNYYSYNYWFNNPEHDCWNQGGNDYYVNTFYEEIIFKLDIPKEGYIVVLGTHNCIALQKLCNFFGKERVIGYDLHNPKNHPNVKIKDCNKLNDNDNVPIAFFHNDLGSFSTTPKLKLHGYNWALKNIINGGYILGNNNLNRAKVKIEELLKENNFENTYLKDLSKEKYNLNKISKVENHNGREFCAMEGYMISKKYE